ncbi:hypothetical protein EDB83DRAFT_2515742 [Lactarius deliciosus]|nr:hypothetical protein EDB83DRAFT_2515742 [Lactarius deliciosus]
MSSTLDVNGRNYPPNANPHVYFARPVSLDTRLLVAPLFTHDPLISTDFYFLTLRLNAPIATATGRHSLMTAERQHRQQQQGNTDSCKLTPDSGDKDISDGSKAASMTTATGDAMERQRG